MSCQSCTPASEERTKFTRPTCLIREEDGLVYKDHVIYPQRILTALNTLHQIDNSRQFLGFTGLAHSKELLLQRLQEYLVESGKLIM